MAGPLAFARKTTPMLRIIVEQYERALSEADFRSVVDYLHQLFDADTARLRSVAAGPARARLLHEMIDAEVDKRPVGLEVSCSRGCAACCHLEVQLSTSEAQILGERVVAGHPIDRARLAAQATRVDRDDAWQAGPVRANRCVFLADDDACSVYADRPAACRKHLVTSPPILCADPRGFPQPLVVPLAEVLLSAALSLDDEAPGTISRLVSAYLARVEHE